MQTAESIDQSLKISKRYLFLLHAPFSSICMNVIWLASINRTVLQYLMENCLSGKKKRSDRIFDLWKPDLIFIIRQIKTIPWKHYPYLENRSQKLVHIHLFDGNSFISNLQITKHEVPQISIILGPLKPFFQLYKRPSKFFRTNEVFFTWMVY